MSFHAWGTYRAHPSAIYHAFLSQIQHPPWSPVRAARSSNTFHWPLECPRAPLQYLKTVDIQHNSMSRNNYCESLHELSCMYLPGLTPSHLSWWHILWRIWQRSGVDNFSEIVPKISLQPMPHFTHSTAYDQQERVPRAVFPRCMFKSP